MHNAPIRLVHACKHARSHARSGANLRWSDILLHQQVGRRVGSTTFLQQRSAYAALTILHVADPQSFDEPAAARPPRLLSPSAAAARIARFREGGGGCARSVWLLLDSPRPQSVTLTRVLRGPSSWCCTRPKRQGWTRTCQRHLHSCHPSH